MKRIFLASFLLCIASQAWGASFDCARFTQHVEWVICHDPEVSALDDAMSEAYTEALSRGSDPKALKDSQKIWLTKVRAGCMTPRCLTEIYKARIQKLQTVGTEGSETQGTLK
ncbi:MAG: lysozyme inhibitor LprI family protein [Deltaproteobacteria bacterium]|nr:lysozyme inhibitor LprI family protein [Deltaproteobacteria bacterium]